MKLQFYVNYMNRLPYFFKACGFSTSSNWSSCIETLRWVSTYLSNGMPLRAASRITAKVLALISCGDAKNH